jgi:hypothetical protein
MRRVLSLAVGVLLLSGVGVRAEEATLRDGRRVQGTLGVDGQGRPRFTAADQTPVPPGDIHYIRWPDAPAPPLRVATLHRVLLADGQALTGQLLGLDEKQLRLRTPWADQLTVPREALVGVTQPGGRVAVAEDDFEDGLKLWKVTGSPTLTDQRFISGKHSLALRGAGQSAEFALSAPPEAGRFGINFDLPGAAAGARWLVEADFQRPDKARTVRVGVAGDGDRYGVEVPSAEGTVGTVTRAPGWHRLDMEFAAGSLVITVDEAVLWHSRKHGPGGPLQRVRLVCAAAGGGGARGEVCFDDFGLARAVEERRRPPGDPEQDEVWLLSGDQVFGRLDRADRRAVEFQGRFGNRTFAWDEVRGVFLRRQSSPPRTADGEQIRVRLRPGTGTELDELEGALRGLDEQHLTLAHPILGELKIDRGRLREVRPAKR